MRALRSTIALLLAACSGARAPAPATPAAPAAPDPRALLRGFVDSRVGAGECRSAHWGVLIVDAARGETL